MHALSEYMRRLAEAAQQFAEQLGGPGLLAIAFMDSSFLTLPEVADLLVVVFTIREPDRWLYFAAMTTAGSILGCYALYGVARMGGRAMVRRGFHERHIDVVLDWCRRHGALVLIVPALLPPPMPFKLFVLMAGIAGIRVGPFLTAVIFGRGIRYGGEAWLARHYGDAAIRFIQGDALRLALPVAVVGLVLVAGWWLWRRRRPRPPAPPDGVGERT
jgi:membrane protein YqaA with SNARE-associated domain